MFLTGSQFLDRTKSGGYADQVRRVAFAFDIFDALDESSVFDIGDAQDVGKVRDSETQDLFDDDTFFSLLA